MARGTHGPTASHAQNRKQSAPMVTRAVIPARFTVVAACPLLLMLTPDAAGKSTELVKGDSGLIFGRRCARYVHEIAVPMVIVLHEVDALAGNGVSNDNGGPLNHGFGEV